MSLLTIVKNVMDANGWPSIVSSVSASQDQNMRQSFALANASLRHVAFKKPWPILLREHEFITVGGQIEYPLPADFHHLVQPSAVNADQYYQVKGSLTPIEWFKYILNGGVNWPEGYKVDPYTKTFHVGPVPSAGSRLIFVYVTSMIARDSANIPILRYAQDTDESLVDEDLVEMGLTWRWRQKKGLDFSAEMAEYNGTLSQRFAQFLSAGELQIGARPMYNYPLTQPTVPPIFGA